MTVIDNIKEGGLYGEMIFSNLVWIIGLGPVTIQKPINKM